MEILVPISVGELVDKITILEIKQDKIKDAEKLTSIKFELSKLVQEYIKLDSIANLTALKNELHSINKTLWVIEDELREMEKLKLFDETFIEKARKVYITNDQRFKVKSQINQICGSAVREVKSYKEY